ncbi:MAG TPA: type IV pilin protein [Aquabacterium sp.]|nr:type IV pilin protein [Aquabacterium sp.]
MKKQRGFTLMELMIGVGIIAILTIIALPSYTRYVQRSARAAAEADLMRAASRLERLKGQNFSYVGATLGSDGTTTVMNYSPSDGTAGGAKYTIALVGTDASNAAIALAGTPPAIPAGAVGYLLTATSTGLFASNGQTEVLQIDNLGRKCYKALGTSVTSCTFGTDPTWP